MKTEEFPLMQQEKDSKHLRFDPKVVKANGLNVLQFIKKSCVREGGTYWIFKDPETNNI
jgi:hypothetical protein